MSERTLSQEWEQAVVARAIDGDETAFTKLYDHYFDRIYRHIFYRVSQPQDAEDLTQQVFLQAWRGIKRYRQTGSPFAAWLFTIAHHVVVSFYRRAKNTRPLDEQVAEWPMDGVLGSDEIQLEHDRVRQAMRLLKTEYQQVLAMRFLEDLGYRDIAAALGRSEGNVRVMQHRALNELRRRLDGRKP